MESIQPLSPEECTVLRILGEYGGAETKWVAERIPPTMLRSRRSHSMKIRSVLMALRRYGMVADMDDQKPICWIRTPKGTEYLRRNGYL